MENPNAFPEQVARIRERVNSLSKQDLKLLLLVNQLNTYPPQQISISSRAIVWIPKYNELHKVKQLFDDIAQHTTPEENSPNTTSRDFTFSLSIKFILMRAEEIYPQIIPDIKRIMYRHVAVLNSIIQYLTSFHFLFLNFDATSLHKKFLSFVKLTDTNPFIRVPSHNSGKYYFIPIYGPARHPVLKQIYKEFSDQPVVSIESLELLGIRYCSQLLLYLPNTKELHVPELPNMKFLQVIAPNICKVVFSADRIPCVIYSNNTRVDGVLSSQIASLDNFPQKKLLWAKHLPKMLNV